MKGEIPVVLVKPDSTYGELQLHNGEIIGLGSEQWLEWLRANASFRFVSGLDGEESFTARKHDRHAGEFWYAYKKVAGKLKNAYLGKSEILSTGRMLEIANKLSKTPKQGANEKQLGNGYAAECMTKQLGKDDSENCITREVMQSLEKKLAAAQAENEQLRSQLEKLKSSEQDLLDQVCKCHSDAFKAAELLKAALKLKSNAGGAIKREIEKVLPLIDDV